MDLELQQSDKDKKLFSYFITGFESILVHMEHKYRISLLELAPLVFRRWYYSTLMEDTVLSPANILELEDRHSGSSGIYSAVSLKMKLSGDSSSKYEFHKYSYSADNHHVVHDLKLMVDFCSPVRAVDENGFLLAADSRRLQSQLTQDDAYYVEYLTMLAYRLELLTELPSIYSKNVQPNKNSESYFSLSPRDILNDIIDESLMICAEKINELLELDGSGMSFKSKTILSFLENPLTADEIFAKIFSSIGFDIERLWQDSENGGLSEFDASMLSSTFFVGLTVDKWLISVFSSYLGIIKPLYYNPYSFRDSVNALCELLILNRDLGLELFSSCSFYSITPLGQELIKNFDTAADKFQQMPENVSFNDIFDVVDAELTLKQAADINAWKENGSVPLYSLKLSYESEPEYSKVLELEGGISLEALGSEILMTFGCEDILSYSLIINDSNGFPLEYASHFSKKPSLLKADKAVLEDLGLKKNSEMRLCPTHEKDMNILIKLLEIKKSNPFVIYPRVALQSALADQRDASHDKI